MALVPLYLVIREASLLRAAIIGWFCGFAVNVGGFFWGIELMDQFSHLSKEMSILNILAVCTYQGTVWLVWAFVCNFFCRYLRLSWLIVAPLFLALLEAAIPMIFPWYLGFTVWRVWPVLQLAELGGPPAVSALLVLINIILAEGVGALFGQHPFFRSVKLAIWVVIIILCLGLVRSIHITKMRSDMPTMKIGIIQPNFGIMSIEDQKRYGQRYIEVLRRGTRELNKLGADLIIWQESAFPVLYDDGPKREHTPSHLDELKGGMNVRFVVDALAHPFGKSFVYSRATLVRDPVHVRGNLRLAPFVYNEDIFQGSVTQVALKKPNLLITLANHAFFGDSTAPHQALALATLRSVETRRDLVRAMNTGVSSIGDALGRIHNETPFYETIGDNHPAPILLVGEVTLTEIFALGPYTTPFFPYACALALAILIVARMMRELMGRPQYETYWPRERSADKRD
jgi:apolipoprotein N-acyltransferase